MRDWLVGGAVIESEERILLVCNRRHGGASDWSPPGGVIDPGEELVDGLAREVLEETGLLVAEWQGPLYEIEAEAVDLGWRLRVEVHRATTVLGSLAVGVDPDGIVVDAGYFDVASCPDRLATSHPWVREPLMEWMAARWNRSRTFRYVVEGSDLSNLVVRRQ